jgi:hypothetical protein
MTTERIARMALDNVPKAIAKYEDFVGVGVVPAAEGRDDMVVAVYVARPVSDLPPDLIEMIPKYLPAGSAVRPTRVKTKIINVGRFEL